MSPKIDFVILWVDDTDPDWQSLCAHYAPACMDNGSDLNRFRDWGLLRYWFRSVERFAPWVNHIYFVTNGQIPSWLNPDHPKLTWIKHADYIPSAYLPTFNSNVIELWLHHIPGLSEQFVLFNDDMFLTAPVQPKDFFVGGLPCDAALLDTVTSLSPEDCLPHMLINNSALLNQRFHKREVMQKNIHKFFTLKYGKDLLRNFLLFPFQNFSAFRDSHLPSSHLKSTFQTVWQENYVLLEACCHNRFRSKTDLTHWLMKGWQICTGNFFPRCTAWGHHYELWEDDIDHICRNIGRQKHKAICINDSKTDIDFVTIQIKLQKSFQSAFPTPSAFECNLEPK